MNGNELVTFVVPVYVRNNNELKFLEETIDGLKNQTDNKWQAIFIEDCSPVVATKDVLLEHQNNDERINVIFQDERISTGRCRNAGIKWAKENNSSIIIYNDADDISHPKRVEVVKKIFKNHPEVAVVYSKFKVIDEYSNFVSQEELAPPIVEILEALKDNPPQGSNCWYPIGLETGYINHTSATAVRTSLAVKELFPDKFVSEDCHTWYRYAAHGDFYYTDKIPSLYRIPSYVDTRSSNVYEEDFNVVKAQVDWDGFSKALDIAVKKNVINKEMRSLIEAKFLLKLAESMGKDKDFELAYSLAVKAKKKLINFNLENL